jgi:hypothetical protein
MIPERSLCVPAWILAAIGAAGKDVAQPIADRSQDARAVAILEIG